MADDIVGGLFGINPAMYQQQQQKQVFDRAVAMQNLDPFQRASVGLQQAGYNLAGAFGGAMGGVDPQLQRISTLNAISKQIDQSNPESMLQGARLLADAGFTQEALGLAQYARKANSEIALAQQRMKEGRAAGVNKDIQIAEYTATLRNAIKQLEAGPSSPETDNQIAELQGRLDALPQPKETTQNTDIFKAQRAGQIVNQLAILKGLPIEQQSPEAIRALETELAVLNPDKTTAVSANIQDSLEIGRLVGEIDKLNKSPEGSKDLTKIKQLEAQLGSLTKNTKQGEFAQILQDAGYIPGSQDYKDKMKEFVNLKLAEKPETKTEAMKNAIAFADLSPYKKDTPEYNEVLSNKFKELTGKPAAADKPNIKEIGVSSKGDAVYLDVNKDEQFIFKIEDGKTVRVPYVGKVDRATSSTKVEVPLGQAMEAVLGATESKEKGAKWAIAGEAYNAAIPMIDKLGQVKASLSSTFTGTGADAKLAFAKGLSALGIPVDSTKISNAEYFNSVSSQLVQAIASVFPGSQSNKELEQLLKSKPNAYQEIPTIVRLIGQLQDEMIASTKTYEQLDALGVKGRSTANPQIIQGKIYTKLRRYRVLEAQAASGKPMQQKDIDEAKKLQQELGVQ
jgi:hypothetical protein